MRYRLDLILCSFFFIIFIAFVSFEISFCYLHRSIFLSFYFVYFIPLLSKRIGGKHTCFDVIYLMANHITIKLNGFLINFNGWRGENENEKYLLLF